MLTALANALRILCVRISDALEPLEAALRQTDFELFVRISDRLSSSESASEAWRYVCAQEQRRGGIADCLASPEINALNVLFEHLGQSGRTSQEEAIHICTLSIESALTEARDRAAQTGKLYTSIGFLAGLAIAVLFI